MGAGEIMRAGRKFKKSITMAINHPEKIFRFKKSFALPNALTQKTTRIWGHSHVKDGHLIVTFTLKGETIFTDHRQISRFSKHPVIRNRFVEQWWREIVPAITMQIVRLKQEMSC